MCHSQVQRQTFDREDLNPTYNALLRSQLLGYDSAVPLSPEKAHWGVSSLTGTQPSTPTRKIFRFMAGDAQSPLAGPQPQSPFTSSPIGKDHA